MSPVVTQVDSAGELTSKNAVVLYDARGTPFEETLGSTGSSRKELEWSRKIQLGR